MTFVITVAIKMKQIVGRDIIFCARPEEVTNINPVLSLNCFDYKQISYRVTPCKEWSAFFSLILLDKWWQCA